MNIVYKTIETPKGYYVYDRNRNAIIAINKQEYEELESIAKKGIAPEGSSVIDKYQREGYLLENRLKKIHHPYSNTLGHHLSHRIEQMTLQVTQRCNLRCEYCIYSGDYSNRVHSNLDMDITVALKAIDLYINSSEEMDTLTIAFYGGEPLLRFDLIKECVAYVKDKVTGKKINFVITTNGTLLSHEISEYLFKNKFNLTISLDGSKNEHDRYRVFENGKGSFDVIMKNLAKMKNNFPGLYQNLFFNTVVNAMHDYKNIKDFFEHDDLVADANVLLSLVEPKENKEVEYSDDFKMIRTFDYLKLLLHMIGKLDQNNVSKLVRNSKTSTYRRYGQITKKIPISEVGHHGGPCIPGARRMFINVHGNIYPCERVSETSEVMRLGHIDTGFDMDKVDNILNVGKITEDLCLQCWALLHCDICAKKADGKDHLSKEIKCLSCPESISTAYVNLKELCVLKELGCTFEM